MDIYVGNLPYGAGDNDLQDLFSQYGAVESARIILDRETGRSKGFGFVKMPNDAEASDAVNAANGMSFMGRNIKVNEAKPQAPRPPRRDFGGGGGGYGGGGGGGGRYEGGGRSPRRSY